MYVFNPVGLGGRPSTITFDPLTGCADPVTAAERATDMLAATGHGYHAAGGDREFWDDQGRRNLAALLHAAALGRGPDDGATSSLAGRPPRGTRRRSPVCCATSRRSRQYVHSVTQFIETNERTRTLDHRHDLPALAWLTHKPAQAAALPERRGRAAARRRRLLAAARHRVHARRGGGPGRAAGVRDDRVDRPRGPPAGRVLPGRAAGPAAVAAAGRGRADLPGPAAPVDRRHGRARGVDRRLLPVPRAADRPLRRRQDRHDHQQLRRPGAVRRHRRPRRPHVLVDPGGGAGRADHHHRPARAGRLPHHPPGPGAGARAAREPAARAGGRVPATMPPVIGRAEQAYRRFDVRAHHTPQAWSVRARIWLTRTAVPWLRRTAVPAAGALGGLYGGVQPGARAARNVDWAPGMGPRAGRRARRRDLRAGLREPARRRVAPLASTRRRLAGHPLPPRPAAGSRRGGRPPAGGAPGAACASTTSPSRSTHPP